MSGAQTSSFYPVNQLLVDNAQQLANQYAPQRNELFVQRAQQEIGGTEIEYAARAAQGLLSLGDEAAMAAAYPGAVASAQQQGFLKNAPGVFPGKARLQQIAAMGISAEKQYEQQGVAGDYQTWLAGRGRGTATSGAAAGGGGGGTTLTPFRAANLPAGVTPEVDQLVRTVYGEANGQPLAGQQAVAHVVLNRAKGSGESVEQVIFKPHQFEPWNSSRRAQLEGLDPNSPEYQRILKQVVQPVLAGQAQDPTGGATHFLNPTLVTSRGDQIPGWASGNRTTIGQHDFYYAPYRGGGQGGGVAARTGGTDVAGPPGVVRGAPAVSAPVTTIEPETGVPVVASPAAPPAAVAPVAAPAQPVTAPPAQQPPAATVAPPPPRLQNGLTAEQDKTIRDLEAIQPRNRADFVAQQKLIATTEQTYRQHNETVDRQYRTDLLTAQREGRVAAAEQERLDIARQAEKRQQDEVNRKAKEALLLGPGGDSLNNYDRRVLLNATPESLKSKEYAASYAKAATPTSEGGVWAYPDMTPFDLPQDKNGKPILSYGQPRLMVGPGDLNKYRAIEEQFNTITYSLDVLKKKWDEASAWERAETLAGKPTTLKTAWVDAALLAKGEGLFQLGVISGPDKGLLQGALADPSTVWGYFTGKKTAGEQIDMVKDLLGQRRSAAKQAYGAGLAIGGPQSSTTTPPPPAGGAPATGGWTVKRIN